MRRKRREERGYSSKTANEQGNQLLAKLSAYISPQVTADVQSRLMSSDEIVAKLQQIATTDVRDFMTWDPGPKEIPAELAQCLESVSMHETQHACYLKLNLHSKVAASACWPSTTSL